MTGRFRPYEAGIVNLWDYDLQRFRFEDGRLVLRGANGSGKTKALEVLIPFVLDGQLDTRRLDPFSGDGRSMRENLLWRKSPRYGYAWLELRHDDGRVVTIGVGMRASPDSTEVNRWYFTTERALGDGWDVVDGEGRPLIRKALAELLGDGAVVATARQHRAAVDRHLYGLGDRYEAMVELVLALRRPMLAKNLDLVMLDRTLRESLRPVDDDLVERSARAFEDLEAVALELERLRAASAASDSFLSTYRTYLLSAARRRLDDAARAELAATAAANAAEVAAVEAAEAAVREAAAVRARAETEQAEAGARQRVAGLKELDAYKGQAQLDDLRGRVADARDVEQRAAAHAAGARARATDAARRRDEAEAHQQRVAAGAATAVAAAAEAMFAAGVETSALAIEAGRDLVRGMVEARRLEVKEVHAIGRRWETAERDAARARTDLEARTDAAHDAVRRRDVAAVATVDGRAAWRTALAEWDDGRVDPVTIGLVADAVDRVGVAGVAPPAAVLATALRPERDRLVTELATAEGRRLAVAADRAGVAAQRADVAAEHDDDPAPARCRPGRAAPGPGAPLWRLVDWAAAVGAAERTGIEAALLASGLLDAWVAPDGCRPAGLVDGFAVAGTATGGPSLADVLVADAGATDVPDETVSAVLASIDLGTAIGADGTYRLGTLAGRAPVEEAGFIGAAARARRRARRLAELDSKLADLDDELAVIAGAIEAVGGRRAALDDAERSLPPITALEEVLRAEAEAATLATAAENERRAAASRAAAAERDALDRRRQFVDAAGRARLGAVLDAVAAAEQAVAVADRALGRAASALDLRRAAAEALETRIDDAERAAQQAEEADMAAAEAAGHHAGIATRLAALDEAIGADVAAVVAQVREAEAERARLGRLVPERRRAEVAAAAAAGEARGRARSLADQVGGAQSAAEEAVALIGTFGHPDLALACGLDLEAGELRLALDRVTRGRSPSDDSLKQNRTAVFTGFQDLEARLGGRNRATIDEEPSGIVLVTVEDDLGPAGLAAFAARLGARVAEQTTYLSVQERQVFEDTLLSALVDQLHSRTVAAHDLVAGMNAVLTRHRTSSGKTVHLSWVAGDDAEGEQRQLLHLLDSDAANLSGDELDRIRRLLAQRVRSVRALRPDARYRDVLADVLDYRAWRSFELHLDDGGGRRERLTRTKYGTLSGGEKSVALHLPLFAAAHATFDSARADCPRLLALDEAFEGIDENGRDELLALTVAFDLDLFLTGYRLWVTSPRVPAVSHYELTHDTAAQVVLAQRVVWNGRALVDDEGWLDEAGAAGG